ncbi:MAG TPA: AraC family ligand binding domain-containing protein [Acidimicrobiales bacterium]|nr:AraC family ligand binding domain-containing protein [Acidimicrobiales bacterium]
MEGATFEREFTEEMRARRATLSVWGNGPGDRYAPHTHGYHKVLLCLEGSIVFHTPDGDVALAAGERLDLAPGTEHSATVGAEGVRCAEAHLP